VDVQTVAQVKADLRGWKLTRSLFVGDAGLVSEANLRALAQGGGKYILCMPVKAGNEVAAEVLARPGRYHPIAPNLAVKEVIVGAGERRRRYVVCVNGEEAQRQRRHREQILAELEGVLPDLQASGDGAHSKRVCALRASERYGQYLIQDRPGRLRIDPGKVRQAERRDGKFVVHSNDDTLTPEDLALGYKQLAQVERAWRLLKSGLRIRPIFHWVPHRICAHVSLTMVALLLERLAETACGDTWRNIRDDLRQIKLAQFLTPANFIPSCIFIPSSTRALTTGSIVSQFTTRIASGKPSPPALPPLPCRRRRRGLFTSLGPGGTTPSATSMAAHCPPISWT
jgi:hypothetical protein